MSNSAEKGILLVGLPKAGKTTFVAALWHVLNSEEITDSLRLSVLGGDDTYLNQIRDEWLNYQEVIRTTQQNEAIPTMHLVDKSGQLKCALSVPDLSGETYVSQWLDREWSDKFAAAARGASGILVFIHPNQPLEAPEITTTMRMLAPFPEEESSSEDPVDEAVWDPERAAGIVQLVEVLQFLQKNLHRPLRIAVMVSAWDLIKARYATPQEFIRTRTPLLEQYMRTNGDTLNFTVFGVSALGGDLESKTDTDRLQNETACASDRIEVVPSTAENLHDITRPLRWALSWPEGESA
ncbi:hypothetical protein ACPOL_4547 [Acidisarcina polymorpha]|uniref:Double-GTPase 1 domain-containing protein n=1 Tax=Acidisarcina polymorpha TaxID=2211140 RepID=A0A2Z5G413_9BACT|nr:hypothetical protein [Acidisarcina polymorpha]AXC13819.1 hypothetical protein ACPOL_4547 [Acidisarcina polymorpha]